MPFFSIIIPAYQCARKLVPTLDSVLAQGENLFELIIVDGGSIDGTRDVLAQYCKQVPHLKYISEPDTGIYDAMNKGIRMATGRFLYFLGAGDRLKQGALEAVAAKIAELPARANAARPIYLYGHVHPMLHDRPHPTTVNGPELLRKNICHQAIFYENSIFSRLGLYNTSYKLLADWAYNIRVFKDSGIEKFYLPLHIADYEGDGASSRYDKIFYRDFRLLLRRECGFYDASLITATFASSAARSWVVRQVRRVRRFLRPLI